MSGNQRSVMLVLVMLLSGACGGPAAKSPSSSPAKPKDQAAAPLIDPCTLLTRAEVDSSLGQPTKEPKSEPIRTGAEEASCAWEPDLGAIEKQDKNACTLQLSLTHQSWVKSLKGKSIKTYYDLIRDPPNRPRSNAVDLQDLGDLAFVDSGFASFTKQGYMVTVFETCPDESKISDLDAKTTALARLAEERLP